MHCCRSRMHYQSMLSLHKWTILTTATTVIRVIRGADVLFAKAWTLINLEYSSLQLFTKRQITEFTHGIRKFRLDLSIIYAFAFSCPWNLCSMCMDCWLPYMPLHFHVYENYFRSTWIVFLPLIAAQTTLLEALSRSVQGEENIFHMYGSYSHPLPQAPLSQASIAGLHVQASHTATPEQYLEPCGPSGQHAESLADSPPTACRLTILHPYQ
jgi:hypothetical protein